jgi:hypothetical protein
LGTRVEGKKKIDRTEKDMGWRRDKGALAKQADVESSIHTIPTPKSYHKPKPREEEDTAIVVSHGVEKRNRARFLVDGVDFRVSPEKGKFYHVDGMAFLSLWQRSLGDDV